MFTAVCQWGDICIYIYMYIYKGTYAFRDTNEYIGIYSIMHTHTHMHTRTHSHIHIHTRKPAYMYACMHEWRDGLTDVCIYVCAL